MDGITHINIYSKGKTSLGRALSNFSHTPIETIDGKFESIEGYWYWLGSEDEDKDYLRSLHGWEAKEVGRELRGLDWQDSEVFKLKIYNAMLTKLILHKNILKEFLENKLPFRHYYVMSGRVLEPAEGKWILNMWTFLQEQLCT